MLAAPAAEVRRPYSFTEIPEERSTFPPSLHTYEARERLMKWNLDGSLKFYRLKFTERFRPGLDTERFLQEFFADKAVKSIFQASRDPVNIVSKRLHTDVLTMDFFDRLEDRGIIMGPEGYIRKCMDEDFHGVLVSDKLREMLVNEESENWDLYSEEEKAEFIFQLFKLLAIGGGMCQSDDTVQGYLNHTKTLYKDLLTVQKNSKTGKVEVSSVVYRILKVVGQGDGGYSLFSRQSPYNTCYLVIDPNKKMVTIMHHDWQAFW